MYGYIIRAFESFSSFYQSPPPAVYQYQRISISIATTSSIEQYINIAATAISISESPEQQYVNIRIPEQQYVNIRIARTAVYQYQNRQNSNMSISESPEQQYVNIRIAATAICQYQNRHHSNISISESPPQQYFNIRIA
jgi:hypothetical protein